MSSLSLVQLLSGPSTLPVKNKAPFQFPKIALNGLTALKIMQQQEQLVSAFFQYAQTTFAMNQDKLDETRQVIYLAEMAEVALKVLKPLEAQKVVVAGKRNYTDVTQYIHHCCKVALKLASDGKRQEAYNFLEQLASEQFSIEILSTLAKFGTVEEIQAFKLPNTPEMQAHRFRILATIEINENSLEYFEKAYREVRQIKKANDWMEALSRLIKDWQAHDPERCLDVLLTVQNVEKIFGFSFRLNILRMLDPQKAAHAIMKMQSIPAENRAHYIIRMYSHFHGKDPKMGEEFLRYLKEAAYPLEVNFEPPPSQAIVARKEEPKTKKTTEEATDDVINLARHDFASGKNEQGFQTLQAYAAFLETTTDRVPYNLVKIASSLQTIDRKRAEEYFVRAIEAAIKQYGKDLQSHDFSYHIATIVSPLAKFDLVKAIEVWDNLILHPYWRGKMACHLAEDIWDQIEVYL